MHERSLVGALLRQVLQIADENLANRVVSIHIRVGEFSGIEPELLASAYNDLVQNSRLCGAALDMIQVPLEAVCDVCGNQFQVEKFTFRCDQCGSLKLTLRGGEEILLDSVTLEEGEP
jgi:hydrogenase nickel incorporation protein HypA/HybF